MDSFAMGLEANLTVATGAKPRNNLILLARSGRVENAMNAGKQENNTKTLKTFPIEHCLPGCVHKSTYGGALGMSYIEDLFLFRLLQNVIDNSREVLLGELIVAVR